MSQLGAVIAAARKSKKLTQAAVADLSNGRVSQQNLSAIEKGRVKTPEAETLEGVADVLDLDVLYLKQLAGLLSADEAVSQRAANEAHDEDISMATELLKKLSKDRRQKYIDDLRIEVEESEDNPP